MANSIESVARYLNAIGEQLYLTGSLTSILDERNTKVDSLAGAKIIYVPKASVSGLVDYDRGAGYSKGSYTLEWVPFELKRDRGTQLTLDSVDNIESAGAALALLESTFITEQVVPELDAYRFSQYVKGANAGNKAYGTLDSSTITKAIDEAFKAMAEAHVPKSNRVLFMNPGTYTLLKENTDSHRFTTGTVVNRNVTMFDEVPIIEVPSDRFYTDVNLIKAGDGGFDPAKNAQVVDFIMMERSSVLQAVKHNQRKLFAPDVNQLADGWAYNYRIYHDALVKPYKDKGIYVHTKTQIPAAPATTPGESA